MDDGGAAKERGQKYDSAMRRVMEGAPEETCALLGEPTTALPRVVPASLATTTLEADLVLRVAPRRLVHVEYQRKATSDLVPRMLIYRGLIMKAHRRARLSQHIIILGEGRVRRYDDADAHGFTLELNVVLVREIEPSVLLATPALAPLAVLGRGNAETRARVLADALVLIDHKGGERRSDLIESAATLALIRLHPNTIARIVEEVSMTSEYTVWDVWDRVPTLQRHLAQRRAEAEAAGRAEGHAEGHAAGQAEMLASLLRERFGDEPGLDDVARQLSALPSAEAVHAVMTAETWPSVVTRAATSQQ